MVMHVSFSQHSLENLTEIHHYIATELASPQAATQRIEALYSRAASLADFPYAHSLVPARKHARMGIRYFAVGEHICLYTIDELEQTVHILAFAYARQHIDAWLPTIGKSSLNDSEN